MSEKPPLGLPPRAIWEALLIRAHLNDRAAEIIAACTRYHVARKKIPEKWIEELVDIAKNGGMQ